MDLGGERTLPAADETKDLLSSLVWVSRIGVSDEERDAIQSAIDEAKEMAEAVRAAARDEEPLYGVVRSSNLMREGTKATLWPLAESGEHLKNAPVTKGDYFKVASILESP